MLSLGIIFLVMTIPLASLYLSTILIHRFALLITLYSVLLSYCMLFVVSLPTDIELLGGLFQSTLSCQINVIITYSFFSKGSFSSIRNNLF